MKKIFMLLFGTAVLTSAFAQDGHRGYDDKNVYNNQTVFQRDHDRMFDKGNAIRQRDMEIQRVASQYDSRIQQVSYDRSLNRRQRKFTIQTLQSQKTREINRIMAEYNSRAFHEGHDRDRDHR